MCSVVLYMSDRNKPKKSRTKATGATEDEEEEARVNVWL